MSNLPQVSFLQRDLLEDQTDSLLHSETGLTIILRAFSQIDIHYCTL